jgi:RNA ligase (TIGR02306 family)
MASTLLVPVVKLQNVRPHPGADKLDLCDVLGYQMCVPRGTYKTGDIGVYFPVDTLIPDEWATKFGIKNFLRGVNKDRVGCVKLRGEPSFGVIAPVQDPAWAEEQNVAEFFGAKKYEPPVKIGVANQAPYDEMIDPLFRKYTDIENGRMFVSVIQEGEDVVVTEKIHGCFTFDTRVMMTNGEERLIGEIKEGNCVLTFNEKTQQFEPQLVKRSIKNSVTSNWLELTIENGRTIKCTENHLFLTKSGWKEAQHLTEDDDLINFE